MIVPVVVEGQSLRWYGRIPEIADNSIEFVQLEFRFPEDWDNMVIVAQFTQTKTYNCLLVNNRCFLPMELVAGPCEVSVFGYLNEEVTRGTTIPLKLNISRSGFVSSAETPIPPTPDLYAQLIEYFSSIAGSGGGGSGGGTINPEDIAAAVEGYLSKNPPEVPDLSDEVERAEKAASDAEAAADRAEEAAKVTTDLDTTLTQAGKAADAKAVGDAISKLSGGKDGGYYTPAVTQPNSETIQFAFTPSKADMPNVNPVTVSLPNPGGDVADEDLPLIGSTDEITPMQAFQAFIKGRQVMLQLTAEDTNLLFTSFSIAGSSDLYSGMIFSTIVGLTGDFNRPQCDVIVLVGSAEGKTWSVMHQQLPVMADVPTDEYIKGLIEAALKNHPGSGGNVELDTTLTQSGKAADAKAVGDKIAEITGISLVEPADNDIPKVYFTGTLPTSKTEEGERLMMHYISKTADFVYPVTLNVQGASSTSYPKKNFTLKPYKDSTYEKKQKLTFKNWPEMNKFVLKAHWIDHSHVRNVGTAKIWGKIVKSRSDYNSLPEELRNAPNNGATDGFTVKVFCNGVYQGLYEWIVPKDKLFGQDSDIATHSILNSESNNQPTCAFATTSPSMSGNWSEELQDSLSDDISNSFSNLIKFVAGSTDEDFVANAENYFDVQSVIDFDIFARVFCIVDNVCRNQIFFTYDGAKWYEGCWDVDAVLGLPPTTRGFFAYDTEFQKGYIAYKDSGVTNLLYQRVETLFMDRFKSRYAELRSGVLSIENILDVYERLTDVITTYDGLLAEDYASTTGGGKFSGIPYAKENNIQQIRTFVSQRVPYMDRIIENMTGEPGGGESGGGDAEPDIPETIPCTGITLSASELTFMAGGNQALTATVTPDGCTEAITWSSDNNAVATVDDGVVTAVGDGSCTVTAYCGDFNASCTVNVSGMSNNLLLAAVWSNGGIDGSTGEEIVWESQRRTNAIDISAYKNCILEANYTGGSSWVVLYDENSAFIGNTIIGSATSYIWLPDNVKYVRFVVAYTEGATLTVNVTTNENLWDTHEIKTGGYPNGTFSQSSNYKHIRVDYDSERELGSYKAWGATYLDANEEKLSFTQLKKNRPERISVPDNTVYIDFSTDTSGWASCYCSYFESFGSKTF